jgi:TonB-dependent receptor
LLEGFGQGLNIPSGVDTSWTTADFDAAAALIDLFNITPVETQGSTRGVTEKDLGGYAQADFNFMLGSMPVRGDVGVRYVQTKTASTGFLSGTEVTVNRKYDDWLPSFNLVLEPVDDVLIRGGIAKVMARPSLGNLTPGGNIDTFTGPPFALSQGNPFLDPYRALNIDLSFEWYFQPESLVAVGLFHKDISSFFQTSGIVETVFSATGLPASVASPTSPLAILLASGADPAVNVTQVLNGSDGKISGLEFVYQQPFTFLPGPLGNLGFTGNYTYVKSSTIIGFSKNSFNATLYYEDGPFGARITGAYRDPYQTARPVASGRTEGREEQGRASTFNLDFAASFEVTEDLELTFEAINLTDEVEHQTFDRLMLPTLYHHTGRNFLLGARYKF